jgi:hypothetical protein
MTEIEKLRTAFDANVAYWRELTRQWAASDNAGRVIEGRSLDDLANEAHAAMEAVEPGCIFGAVEEARTPEVAERAGRARQSPYPEDR